MVFEGWLAGVSPICAAILPSLVARIEYVLLLVGGYKMAVSLAVRTHVPELFQPLALVLHRFVVPST